MNDIRKLVRIQIVVLITFILNRFLLRPFILENDLPHVLQLFTLSYPNFCEAIVGTLSLTYIGLYLNQNILPAASQLSNPLIYLLATITAAVYVIAQELQIHNLGGQNIYDPYDVVFSVLGLCTAYLILHLLKPTINSATESTA